MVRWILGLMLALGPAGSLMAQGEVKVDQLAVKTAETLEKMDKTGAAWSMTVDQNTPVRFIVDYVSFGEVRRVTIKVKVRTQAPMELARIYQTQEAWYVEMEGRKEKYRPYEADIGGPNFYAALSLSELSAFRPELNLENPRVTAEGRIEFRMNLPGELVALMKENVSQMKKVMEANPDRDPTDLLRMMKMQQEMIDKGSLVEVDPNNGVITRQLNPRMELLCESFRILKPEEAGFVSFKREGYVDKTGPVAQSMEDVAIMGYRPGWEVGDPSGDPEMVFLDLSTGKHRRIPSQSFSTGPGCLSKDRKTAWVTTMDLGNSGMGITEIDLKTGENRPLGTKLSLTGMNMFPAISPDGGKLLFLHKEFGKTTLDSSVVLVDLKTREEKIIGSLADRGQAHWAQKDQLVFELRDSVDLTKPGEGSKITDRRIAVMDLTGKTRVLMKGSSPVVVGAGDLILFEDVDEKWKTCDLEGKQISVVGDGLKGFGFPSASPDGKRVLFMRSDEKKGPQPWVVELATGKATQVKVDPGLWMMPSWR